jgi:hypothetical protein
MTTIEFEKYVRQGLGRTVRLLRAEADKSPCVLIESEIVDL